MLGLIVKRRNHRAVAGKMYDHAFRYETWAATHQGKVRQLNEDRYLAEPGMGLWLVADGMGGHDAGEVASAGIVAELKTMGVSSSAPDQHARFVDRLARANEGLRRYSEERDGKLVGSTVAALLAFGNQYRCLWVGDSRIYLIRRGAITQLSRDHSEVQELIEKGLLSREEARTWPRRNVITRAVGAHDAVEAEVVYGVMEPGDCFLLCSDGLTAHVSDEDILEAVSGRKAREACDILLELTLSRGAIDNVTIVIVQCRAIDTTIPVDTGMMAPAE